MYWVVPLLRGQYELLTSHSGYHFHPQNIKQMHSELSLQPASEARRRLPAGRGADSPCVPVTPASRPAAGAPHVWLEDTGPSQGSSEPVSGCGLHRATRVTRCGHRKRGQAKTTDPGHALQGVMTGRLRRTGTPAVSEWATAQPWTGCPAFIRHFNQKGTLKGPSD